MTNSVPKSLAYQRKGELNMLSCTVIHSIHVAWWKHFKAEEEGRAGRRKQLLGYCLTMETQHWLPLQLGWLRDLSHYFAVMPFSMLMPVRTFSIFEGHIRRSTGAGVSL